MSVRLRPPAPHSIFRKRNNAHNLVFSEFSFEKNSYLPADALKDALDKLQVNSIISLNIERRLAERHFYCYILPFFSR
jgi:hypothetical protein